MNNVESMITGYAKWNSILVDPKKHKQREIISIEHVTELVFIIDKYVNKQNAQCEHISDIQIAELENIRLHEINESKRLEYKMYKLNMLAAPPVNIQPILSTRTTPITITYTGKYEVPHTSNMIDIQSSIDDLTDEFTDSEPIQEEQYIEDTSPSAPELHIDVPLQAPIVPINQPIMPIAQPVVQPTITNTTVPIPIKVHKHTSAPDPLSAEILKTLTFNKFNKTELIECPCGEHVKRQSFRTHVDSKKHKKQIATKK